MEEFLRMAASQFGLSSDQARQATSGLLGFLQKESDPSDFQELIGKLPGATQLLGQGEAAAGSDGGLLGAVGSLLGGKLGSSLGLVSSLQEAGLDASSAGGFVGAFADFAKNLAGADLVDRISGSVPELKKLLN